MERGRRLPEAERKRDAEKALRALKGRSHRSVVSTRRCHGAVISWRGSVIMECRHDGGGWRCRRIPGRGSGLSGSGQFQCRKHSKLIAYSHP